MQRKNFSFKFEWHQAIAHYSPEIRLEIYEAVIRYAETGQLGHLSLEAAVAFEKYFRPDFERRRKAAEYRARRKAAEAKKSEESRDSESSEISDTSYTSTTPEPTEIPTLLRPNRRERRRMEAEERRFRKKRMGRRLAG